jgi:hypothetical protein
MTPFVLLLLHLVVSCAAQLLQLVWPQVGRDFGAAATEGWVDAKVFKHSGTLGTYRLSGPQKFAEILVPYMQGDGWSPSR